MGVGVVKDLFSRFETKKLIEKSAVDKVKGGWIKIGVEAVADVK